MALIQFAVTSATTSANVPTIGGGPCPDPSLPLVAKVTAYLPTATIEWVSNVTCNGDGTITKTYDSKLVVVPFP
jgi:hypothetical protein